MPELQDLVVGQVARILRSEIVGTPSWLIRPGRAETGRRWGLVQSIYGELTGLELPEVMRPVERRTVDAVLRLNDGFRIFEFDEKQHFNQYRALTLRRYTKSVRVAFPKKVWIERCDRKQKLEGAGFAVPRPPLFPGDGGRHRQRAFRDALCDIVPPAHGYLPTLRIGDFEVKSWIRTEEAPDRMHALLSDRLGSA